MRAIGVCLLFVCACNAFFGIDPTKLELPDAPPLIDAIGCSGSTFSGLTPFPISLSPVYDPVLSGDASQLWFDHSGAGGHAQIYFATGAAGGAYSGDTAAPFVDASGATECFRPALTEDGLHLVFVRAGTAYEVSRAVITGDFSSVASPLGSLATLDSVALNRTGLTAYFSRSGEIYSASRPLLMDDFTNVVDLGVAGNNPTISPDELELFYDTNNQPDGNVMRSVRPTAGSPFGPPQLIQTNAYEPSITFDSRTLLMVQSSTAFIVQMTRSCP